MSIHTGLAGPENENAPWAGGADRSGQANGSGYARAYRSEWEEQSDVLLAKALQLQDPAAELVAGLEAESFPPGSYWRPVAAEIRRRVREGQVCWSAEVIAAVSRECGLGLEALYHLVTAEVAMHSAEQAAEWLRNRLEDARKAEAVEAWSRGEPDADERLRKALDAPKGGLLRKVELSSAIAARARDAEYIVGSLVARGAITELVGPLKLAGKSTLILGWTRAAMLGRDWCGLPTADPGRVLLLTEQSDASLSQQLRRANLPRDVETLRRGDMPGNWCLRAWEDLASEIARERYGLVIVDTTGPWFGLADENSNAENSATLPSLLRIAGSGAGLVLARHSRKGGGIVGEAGRGGSAMSGNCDITLNLEPVAGSPNKRKLVGAGRLDGCLSPGAPLVVEWRTGGEYVASSIDCRDEIAERIAAAGPDGVSVAEIAEALGKSAKAVDKLVRGYPSHPAKTGAGGHPRRFYLQPSN